MTSARDLQSSLGGPLNNEAALALIAKGTDVLTIDHASQEELGQDKDLKTVIYFTEIKNCIVLNKSRAAQLVALFEDEPIEGKKVKITVANLGRATQIIFNGVD